MFQHPGHIPVKVALAIWRVMHNQATVEDWYEFDCHPRDTVVEWAVEIVRANDTTVTEERLAKEREWWNVQLRAGDN